MFYVKISRDNTLMGVLSFASSEERYSWLLDNGFVDDGFVWYHPFSGEVAGTFSSSLKNIEEEPSYHTCDQRIARTKGPLYACT